MQIEKVCCKGDELVPHIYVIDDETYEDGDLCLVCGKFKSYEIEEDVVI
jgi:hypothetical protein